MKELRKREYYPDASYDLTGDGSVSQKEFQIASLFDKNKDGILDDEERKQCIKALVDGLEGKQKYHDDFPVY